MYSGKGLLPPPVIGQRCIVPTSGSKLLGTPMAGYSGLSSPANGCKCTYKRIGQPIFWSLKYGQLCTPDDEIVNNVILSVNTNALKCYKTLPTTNAVGIRRTQLACGGSTGHLKCWTAGAIRVVSIPRYGAKQSHSTVRRQYDDRRQSVTRCRTQNTM